MILPLPNNDRAGPTSIYGYIARGENSHVLQDNYCFAVFIGLIPGRLAVPDLRAPEMPAR